MVEESKKPVVAAPKAQSTPAADPETGLFITDADGNRRSATALEVAMTFDEQRDRIASLEQLAAQDKVNSSREISSAHAQMARLTRQNKAQGQQINQLAKLIEGKDDEIARLKQPKPPAAAAAETISPPKRPPPKPNGAAAPDPAQARKTPAPA